MMKHKTTPVSLFFASAIWLLASTAQVSAQDLPQRLSHARNSSSQRYEINQTFDGQAYRKDNNVWVYTKEFADIFGMPGQYIGDVRGVAAAAFRVEDTSFQECGFFGKADACRRVEACLLDLYFDESKEPLPWVTDSKSQWKPSYSSMIWLRPPNVEKERPHGTLAIDPPKGVIRNELTHSAIIPFADPKSKVEAIFTTNANSDRGGPDEVSGALPIRGYMRSFYRDLSVVNVQFSCTPSSRQDININLDAKRDGVFESPLARFNRVYLPKLFVQRINELQRTQNAKNAIPNLK